VKTVVNLLAKLAFDNPNDWDLLLDYVCHNHNCSRHTSHGQTPNSVLFGFEARQIGIDVPGISQFVGTQDPVAFARKGFVRTRELVSKNLEKARLIQKQHYDKRRVDSEFQVGDLVLVREVKIRESGNKLAPCI